MQTSILLENVDGIVRLRLNRADRRNALSRAMLRELQSALLAISQDSSTRILILESTGSVFCAGMDLREMQARAESPSAEAEWRADSQVYCDCLCELLTLPCPTIAAVQGGVLAGGMGLVLACDFIVAASSAFFALPEPARGITAAMVTPLLIWRIGTGAANRWLLSLEQMGAEVAQRQGLCHDVVASDALLERVATLCGTIRMGSPLALQMTKEHVRRCAGFNPSQQILASMQLSADARKSDDAREGLQAFLEKRKPRWQL